MSSYDHLAEHLADEAKGNHGGKSLSKVGAQKFTKSTKAYAKLKKMFEDKLILPTDGAKDVRARILCSMTSLTTSFVRSSITCAKRWALLLEKVSTVCSILTCIR